MEIVVLLPFFIDIPSFHMWQSMIYDTQYNSPYQKIDCATYCRITFYPESFLEVYIISR